MSEAANGLRLWESWLPSQSPPVTPEGELGSARPRPARLSSSPQTAAGSIMNTVVKRRPGLVEFSYQMGGIQPIPAAQSQGSGIRQDSDRQPWAATLRAGAEPRFADEADLSDSRWLTVLFRRNPEHDDQCDRIRYEGYHICWPDGEPVSLGFGRFCQQGTRLLGLGRRMQGKAEQLVEVGLHPVHGLEAPLTRLGPGARCRRFFLERRADAGKIFFFNGSPTEVEFHARKDEPRVLEWLGLPDLRHGERLWFDLSAQSVS